MEKEIERERVKYNKIAIKYNNKIAIIHNTQIHTIEAFIFFCTYLSKQEFRNSDFYAFSHCTNLFAPIVSCLLNSSCSEMTRDTLCS